MQQDKTERQNSSYRFRHWENLPRGESLRLMVGHEIEDSLFQTEGERLLLVGSMAGELDVSSFQGEQKICVDACQGPDVDLMNEPHCLAIQTRSVDIVVLPLVLDFYPYPHQILAESHRVLVEGGCLIIIVINPYSFWGSRSWWGAKQQQANWPSTLLSNRRIEDWLNLLQFQICNKKTFGPLMPMRLRKKTLPFSLSMGKKKANQLGGLNMLVATKTTESMIHLRDRWRRFELQGNPGFSKAQLSRSQPFRPKQEIIVYEK